ncbi:hypothetical protein ACFSJU_03815 [Paradesertivirga mongoliensis]|uniref:Uncharacterized protein n=1 Tax=Paradesertivirga mongoliensis TaxID=2100740 RepID=A0ABW4ZI51_9SPHI|nr:hypothetical protein [Pedobacter mongoliensis]
MKTRNPSGLIAEYPEDYKFSSARFYFDGSDEFNLVTHYKG